MAVKLHVDDNKVTVNIVDSKVIYVGGEPYEGEYTVIPAVTEQTLETREKLLADNITVKEIPYYEVSNPTGTTVIIGG